jgi:predicted RNase H-like nuclease (RuvC/YqgF family)
MHHPQAPSWLVAVLVAIVPTAAQSNDPDSPKESPRFLSRAELRDCMDRDAALQQRQDALEQANAEHNAESARLSAQAGALSARLRALDPSDRRAVNAYNKRNEERNRRVETSNQRAETLQAAVEEHQAASADFMAQCAARPFLKSDEEAVLREAGRERKPLSRKPDRPAVPRPADRCDT